MGEPATASWSSHEIDVLLVGARGAAMGPAVIDEDTVMLPPRAAPEPECVAERTLVMTPVSGVRRVVLPMPMAEVRVRDRIVELAVLAALGVIGFAIGLSLVAGLCAAAQRPWL